MNTKPVRILVAEDNRLLAEVLNINLRRAGFDVTIAANGAIAVEQLRQHAFDLLITDYQMPEVDGAQLCQIIRHELQLRDLPILICTAKGLEIDIDHLLYHLGVARIVYKPFSMREIVQLARQLTDPQPVRSLCQADPC